MVNCRLGGSAYLNLKRQGDLKSRNKRGALNRNRHSLWGITIHLLWAYVRISFVMPNAKDFTQKTAIPSFAMWLQCRHKSNLYCHTMITLITSWKGTDNCLKWQIQLLNLRGITHRMIALQLFILNPRVCRRKRSNPSIHTDTPEERKTGIPCNLLKQFCFHYCCFHSTLNCFLSLITNYKLLISASVSKPRQSLRSRKICIFSWLVFQ